MFTQNSCFWSKFGLHYPFEAGMGNLGLKKTETADESVTQFAKRANSGNSFKF
jgi:hypothetical protein